MDVLDRADLPFPHSLPEFQRLFPDDAACAAYLEKARWGDGFACPHCGTAGEPFHFENRPASLGDYCSAVLRPIRQSNFGSTVFPRCPPPVNRTQVGANHWPGRRSAAAGSARPC